MAKKYWSRKKQIRKRKKYTYGRKAGEQIGGYFDRYLPPGAKYMSNLGAWAGSSVDQWRYKRHIYNNRIRVYRRIGSRPYTGPRGYMKPNPSGYISAPSGVGRYRKFS